MVVVTEEVIGGGCYAELQLLGLMLYLEKITKGQGQKYQKH